MKRLLWHCGAKVPLQNVGLRCLLIEFVALQVVTRVLESRSLVLWWLKRFLLPSINFWGRRLINFDTTSFIQIRLPFESGFDRRFRIILTNVRLGMLGGFGILIDSRTSL